MRKYECRPVGKPNKAKTVYVPDSRAHITGLKPNTIYEIRRGENIEVKETDENGNIRIGAGYSLGF